MLLKRIVALGLATTGALLSSGACGSRSTLLPGEPGTNEETDASVIECRSDQDCGDSGNLCGPWLCLENRCVQRFVVCSDDDPCTDDACDPETGKCVSTPATIDLDGDGFKGPRPGTVPGAPDSCGDDCDDTSAAAYPGAAEVCDSVDNDCNGVVDDGYGYAPASGGPPDVLVSPNDGSATTPGGLAQDGERYFAVYGRKVQGKQRAFSTFLDQLGNTIGDAQRLVQVESDSYVAGVVWTGDRYGVVWSDRRASNYEVYFATFDRQGKKMAPGDVQLSSSFEFSINVDLVWTGTEFVAVWQDGSGDNGSFRVVGRRVSLTGTPLGEIVPISDNGESPRLAVGRPGMGLVYTSSDENKSKTTFFRPLDFELRTIGTAKTLDTPIAGSFPSVRWNESEYVVSWGPESAPFELYGMRVSGTGETLSPARALTDSPGNARFGSIIPLGDRLVLIYSDDRDGGRYEIYSQTLNSDLSRRGVATRITNQRGDSVSPIPILGPRGDIGVLFRDQRNPSNQTYFTRLVCEAGND